MQKRFALVAMLTLFSLAATTLGQRRPPGPRDPGSPDSSEEPAREAKLHETAPKIKAAAYDNAQGEVSLERYRGRIVLLFFFRTDDPASVEALPKLNKIHADYGDRRVVVIGLTPQKKAEAEGVIKGKEVKFIVGYEADTTSSYKVPAPPLVYMIDTHGVLTDRFHPADALEDKLQAQIRATPPQGADLASLQAKFDKARLARTAGEIGKAYTLAREVQKLVDEKESLGQAVKTLIDELEKKAKEKLEEAKTAAKDERYDKAVPLLAELSVRFQGTDIGGEADNEIGRLMGKLDVKRRMTTALDNAKGQVLNEQAAEHEAANQYMDALTLYRKTSEEYPDTDAAKEADEAIERIRSDPRAQQIIEARRAEAQADRWLDIGDRFAKVEMYNKAREYYQRTIESYPTTMAASKCRERLVNLPEEKEEPPEEEVPVDEDDTTGTGQE